jgi:hypothetical protein
MQAVHAEHIPECAQEGYENAGLLTLDGGIPPEVSPLLCSGKWNMWAHSLWWEAFYPGQMLECVEEQNEKWQLVLSGWKLTILSKLSIQSGSPNAFKKSYPSWTNPLMRPGRT